MSHPQKLTRDDAARIRAVYVPRQHPTRRELAAQYGVDYSTIARILDGSIWV